MNVSVGHVGRRRGRPRRRGPQTLPGAGRFEQTATSTVQKRRLVKAAGLHCRGCGRGGPRRATGYKWRGASRARADEWPAGPLLVVVAVVVASDLQQFRCWQRTAHHLLPWDCSLPHGPGHGLGYGRTSFRRQQQQPRDAEQLLSENCYFSRLCCAGKETFVQLFVKGAERS